ncbi:MAG: hypothetical protein E7522_04365 [Ruminococcaceae bacterium]|nr:hypothetical protein [Oscillospiraceae bacterium]
MSVCPVCGCKTDELDFVLCTIEKNEEMVCSFCEKQIKKLYSDSTPATAQVRWLSSVLEKEVPSRPQNISVALNAMKSKFVPETNETVSTGAIESQVNSIKRDVNMPINSSNGAPNISVDQYNNLIKRLEKLEGDFAKYKKSQLIKMIIELGLPVLMLILLAIIFFASGLYESLSQLLSIL